MYLPIASHPTNVQGWLAAATVVRRHGGEAQNVIIDITDPLSETCTDTAILRNIDGFLHSHGYDTLIGVANTIFPQSVLRRHGPEEFYDVYRDRLLPRMKSMTRDWGRYFERLIVWKRLNGRKVETINPLKDLIRFMKTQIESQKTYRNVYELTIYDPTRDAGKVSNRQCMSFLSFKLTNENKLLLTVMYRNHAYIARALGNFIGLGRLMAFVANQSGAQVGSLTCISTHAWIDSGKRIRREQPIGWTQSEAHQLLDDCLKLNDLEKAA